MKAFIIFPDSWLPFSPTVLNLSEELFKSGYDPYIIWLNDNRYPVNQPLSFSYSFNIPKILSIFLDHSRLGLFIKPCLLLWQYLKYGNRNSIIIGVDSMGFFCAKLLSRNNYFLSLEANKTPILYFLSLFGIDYFIIQSKIRANYLLPSSRYEKLIILPNSPSITGNKLHVKPLPKGKLKIIYLGNIIKNHGIEELIIACSSLLDLVEITLHGPGDLEFIKYLRLTYNRCGLTFSSSYISQNHLNKYLSGFDVGYVAYDLKYIATNDFNYLSSPSGKMYNYFLAGIPVIGLNIPGLLAVRDYNAGVLVDEISDNQIIKAIGLIKKQYSIFSENALAAAQDFSFDSHYSHKLLPFLCQVT